MVQCSWRQKIAILALYVVAYFVFYIIPNFHPLFTPVHLPLLAIDQATPFLPWTFIIYLSDYLLIAFVIVMIRDLESFYSFSRMAFLTLFLCGTVFLLYPTAYPRPGYPSDVGPVVGFFMNLVGTADTPNNCFPSMHVACTGMAAWSMRRQPLVVLVLLVIWSLAIFVSTMTTKQHYLVDILGGIAMVFVVAYFDRILARKGILESWIARARG